MKIGILSFAQSANYGGILQSYALQTVLQRMGHDVVVFNRQITKQKLPFYKAVPQYIKRCINKYIRHKPNTYIFAENVSYRWRKANTVYTWAFVNKYINNKFINSLSDLKNEYDAIVVGSDQVWRKTYFLGAWCEANMANAFLAFTDRWNIKRISYAASFGTDQLELNNQELAESRNALQKFDAVSVREDTAVEICRNYFEVDALWVVDPTMLLNVEYYLSLAEDRESRFNGNYLLKYALDESSEIYDLVRRLEKEKNIKYKEIKTHERINMKEIDDCARRPVEEWLYAFAHADYVLTDSFHGTVFSILFHKQFTVIANKDRGITRFTSLLRMFGLEDRLIYFAKDYHGIPDINYNKVNDILKEKRIEAFHFLQSNLTNHRELS